MFLRPQCHNKNINSVVEKKNVLVCEDHKTKNEDLFEVYKTAEVVDKTQILDNFSKQIYLVYNSGAYCHSEKSTLTIWGSLVMIMKIW